MVMCGLPSVERASLAPAGIAAFVSIVSGQKRGTPLATSPNPALFETRSTSRTLRAGQCAEPAASLPLSRVLLARRGARRHTSVVHNNRVQATLGSRCAGVRPVSGKSGCAAPHLSPTVRAPRSPTNVVAEATTVGVRAAARARGRPRGAKSDQWPRAACASRPHAGSGRTPHFKLEDPVT
jgi:hypothetical protein